MAVRDPFSRLRPIGPLMLQAVHRCCPRSPPRARTRYAETLIGFTWIARAGDHLPGARFNFWYEEALGYIIGDVVRDNDGGSAALMMLAVGAEAKAAGRSVRKAYDRAGDRTRRAPDPSGAADR
jgi:phosphomannomutase